MAELQTYTAKVFLFVPEEQTILDAGYEKIHLERRKKSTDPWTRLAKPEPLTIEVGRYNYSFVDPNAQRGWEYRPVLVDDDAVEADLPQDVVPAVDAAFEAVCTVQQLKDRYLFGLEAALSNDQGVPLPDRVYVHYIQAAIATFEQKVNIRVLPQYFEEKHDYHEADVRVFHTFNLDEFPVLSVQEVVRQLPGQEEEAYESSWIQLQKEMGQLNLVPESTSSPLTWLSPFRLPKWVPNFFTIRYFAGFAAGTIPANVVDIIGKMAALGPLNVAGDLLGGAGIASQSISLDGLSTSFNTTSSATNAGFGARVIQYTKEIKNDLPIIIAYYKGLKLRAI